MAADDELREPLPEGPAPQAPLAVRLRSHLRSVRRVAEERVRLRRADAALVSFPKCGRTWIRVMLSRLCQQRWGLPEDFLLLWDALDAAPAVPRILFAHDTYRLPAALMGLPRGAYRRIPVALVVRHPADVVVSLQMQLRHRTTDAHYRAIAGQPLAAFAWHHRFGLPAIVAFMNAWAAERRRHPRLMIQRYEDFREDAARELAALAAHFGLPAGPAAIADAVEFASFERMRERERAGFYGSRILQPGDPNRPETFKVRAGRTGAWRERFSPSEVERITGYLAERLDPVFGYEASRSG